MKKKNNNLLRGFSLGTVLFIIQKFLIPLAQNMNYGNDNIFVILNIGIFSVIITLFILTGDFSNLFVTGFVGLFVLIGEEIVSHVTGLYKIIEFGADSFWFITYLYGILGALIAIVISLILTAKGVDYMPDLKIKIIQNSETNKKGLLIGYFAATAITVPYLVLKAESGLGILIFAIIQFIFLCFIVSNKKRLVYFIPVFIFALNSFLSDSRIWQISNIFVSVVIYAFIFGEINFKHSGRIFFESIMKYVIAPFKHFNIPLKWFSEINNEKANLIKRIGIAVLICIPLVCVTLGLLISADLIFQNIFENITESFVNTINIATVFKIAIGIFVGFYLFGFALLAGSKTESQNNEKVIKGDIMIINIVLSVVVLIYFLFIIVQIKYLFAGSILPYGLTYTEYARRGFFELFLLTGINIVIIVLTVKLSKYGEKIHFTKILQSLLCASTIVLLVSSFYRMYLYTNEYGFTRMRFLVMGFLIFEFIGLVVTFFYIKTPKFSIGITYFVIALTYYTVLNLTPIDYFVAKSQVDRYFNGDNDGIEYTLTLSRDASLQIKRIAVESVGEEQLKAINYIVNCDINNKLDRNNWRQLNISVLITNRICHEIK